MNEAKARDEVIAKMKEEDERAKLERFEKKQLLHKLH